MKTKTKISWAAKKISISEIQIRSRRDDNGEEREYAVIKVKENDYFDEMHPLNRLHRGKTKFITLMCFKEDIWRLLEEKEKYSLTGFVSFGYGNTYLVIEKAFDCLGLPLSSKSKELSLVS